MTVLRSILLTTLAALAEIGGAWLVWQASANIAAGSLSAPASLSLASTALTAFPVAIEEDL